MSKIIILCEQPKKISKIIGESEKYTVSDKITDPSCDVIHVSRGTSLSAADIDMVANMLSKGEVVVGVETRKSAVKALIYKFFGASHGENSCGIVGIPSKYACELEVTKKSRSISIIRKAEIKKLPILEMPVSKTEVQNELLSFVADMFDLFLLSQPLKFLFSSGVAFIIDYVLLLTLSSFLNIGFGDMEISALIAWCISSLTNFFLNRIFVFRSNAPFWPSFAEYYGLAGAVFVLKTYVLLEILTRVLHINLWLAKLIAEVVFFVSNYFIQKKLIFKSKAKKDIEEKIEA